MTPTDTWICPSCGAEVPVGARGCPHCSKPAQVRKRARTGGRRRRSWEQDPGCDELDLPDEDFDYDEFVAREFGRRPHRAIGVAWYWWLTALVLAALLVWARVFGGG